MGSRQILLLIVTALYFWLCHVFVHKVCTSCDGCNADRQTEEVLSSAAATNTENTNIAAAEILEPIVFNWAKSEAITSNKFAAYRDNLKAQLEDGKTLEVYGYYFRDEVIPEGYANMGLARADELIELLSESIPKERMTARARLIKETDGVRKNLFVSTNTRWVDAEPEVEEEKTPKEDVARVDEVDDRALIYFPFNSVKKEVNKEVDGYLDKLAAQLKGSGQTVTLTGHTDDVGSPVSNFGLAERRAKMIRDILRKKGVPNNKIVVNSKGETEPTAPNNTDANRRLNRRVEVQLN